MTVVRWKITDVFEQGEPPYTYTLDINPNEGGSLPVSKNITNHQAIGPHHGNIIQEGGLVAPAINWSGFILGQSHIEALEYWHHKQILVDLEDDLGRLFRGVLTSFTPERAYRPYRPYYHTYSASLSVIAYRNASGEILFGAFDDGVRPRAIDSAANLLTNPSFEVDVVADRSSEAIIPTGWSFPGGEPAGYAIHDALYPNYSDQVFKMLAPTNGEDIYLSQSVALEPGSRVGLYGYYYLDFAASAVDSNSGRGLFVGVTYDGNTGFDQEYNETFADKRIQVWDQVTLPQVDSILIPEEEDGATLELRLHVPTTTNPPSGDSILYDHMFLRLLN